MSPSRTTRAPLLVLLSWLGAASCSDPSLQPSRLLQPAELQIRASLAGTSASTLVVTVSASDIQPPLIFNVNVVNGTAAGTIAVPAGADRLVLVRAFDGSGILTHEGSRRVDVRPGENPALSISLIPLIGDQPIDVRIGNFVVQVTPGNELIAKRHLLALSALVTDLDGATIMVDPAAIRWASFDTRIATVNTSGVVTGHSVGDVQVVASYGGAAGAAVVSVGEPVVATGDIARCGSTDDDATAAIVDTLDGVVLTAGDHAYEDGTIQEFEQCYDPSWGRHKARTRPVPGNHEYQTANAAGYFQYFDEILRPFGDAARDPARGYYTFDVGSWRIIALNSEVSTAETSAQLAWLKGVLATTTNKCVLAYWHRARYSSGAHHGSSPQLDPIWDTLFVMGADLVVAGHEHNYERFAPQNNQGVADPQRGMREFVVGTGGAELYGFADPPRATSEVRLSEFGVLALVLGTDSYSWRFIGASDGGLRDSGRGVCH